jgi:hypothetical protein
MKWTIKHYYPFPPSTVLPTDSLLSPHAWEQLRTDDGGAGANPDFHLPSERGEWLRLCEESEFSAACARGIAALVRREKFSSVVSVGAGRALIEYHLKALLPSVALTCTEYSPGVVERLRHVFTECDRIELLDVTAPWAPVAPGQLVLFNRLDTELDDDQWRRVFSNLASAAVPTVLVVATGFLTPKTLLLEVAQRAISIVRRRPLTFAGYTRTRARFRDLWASHYRVAHEVPVGSLTGFLLVLR